MAIVLSEGTSLTGSGNREFFKAESPDCGICQHGFALLMKCLAQWKSVPSDSNNMKSQVN